MIWIEEDKAKRPGWEKIQGPGCEVEDPDKRRGKKSDPEGKVTQMSDLEGNDPDKTREGK